MAVVAVSTIPAVVLFWLGLRLSGAAARPAAYWALLTVVLLGIGGVLTYRRNLSGVFSRQAELDRITLVWSAVPASFAGGTVVVLLGLPWPIGVVAAGLVGASLFVHYRGMMRRRRLDQVELPCRVRTVGEATELVEVCDRWIEVGGRAAARPVVTANLVHGLLQRTILTANPDGLGRAIDLLEGLLRQPDLDPLVAFGLAQGHHEAAVIQTERHGDDHYLERSVEDLAKAAERLPDTSVARAQAAEARADLALYQASRPGVGDDELLELVGRAVAFSRVALAECPPGSSWRSTC